MAFKGERSKLLQSGKASLKSFGGATNDLRGEVSEGKKELEENGIRESDRKAQRCHMSSIQ